MCDLLFNPLTKTTRAPANQFGLALLTAFILSLASADLQAADSKTTELLLRPPLMDGYDPFESESPAAEIPKPTRKPARKPFDAPRLIAPVDERSYLNLNPTLRVVAKQANYQTPAPEPAADAQQADLTKDPCAGLAAKPLGELGISIALPAGQLPNDPATACWAQLNESAGALAAMRAWATFVYNWDATCLCHRPLYFEQINLERHGYGCPTCLQVGVSGAHFFGTVLALPYCMAVECPCECVYTLGHYRPGSCPPWRHHWPPCKLRAIAAEGGVWTGMIFLIP
jgi:hypothetical protein